MEDAERTRRHLDAKECIPSGRQTWPPLQQHGCCSSHHVSVYGHRLRVGCTSSLALAKGESSCRAGCIQRRTGMGLLGNAGGLVLFSPSPIPPSFPSFQSSPGNTLREREREGEPVKEGNILVREKHRLVASPSCHNWDQTHDLFIYWTTTN